MEPVSDKSTGDLTRRTFVGAAAISSGVAAVLPIAEAQPASTAPHTVTCTLTINNQRYSMALDPRTTLLDLLRERLHLTGTKKGCDHGQCGACTVLVNDRRINACLSLAVVH